MSDNEFILNQPSMIKEHLWISLLMILLKPQTLEMKINTLNDTYIITVSPHLVYRFDLGPRQKFQ